MYFIKNKKRNIRLLLNLQMCQSTLQKLVFKLADFRFHSELGILKASTKFY